MNAVVNKMPERQPLQAITPMEMLNIAVQQGADIDKMKQLMELSERWEANQARKAFVAAMAEFKKNPPEVLKNKHVEFTNSKGGVTKYDHATLADVCVAAIKGLADHGISHRWDVAQSEGRIKVTCILTHEAGHSESVSLHSEADTSGSKNTIQAMGSAITYLQRYTLLSATGLAAKDLDDDGRATGKQPETVSEEQIANIKALMTEVNANQNAFMRWAKINSLDQILSCNYVHVIKALEEKRKK
jgi:hypothetical protein